MKKSTQKPGKSRNPLGRPQIAADLRRDKRLEMRFSAAELRQLAADKEAAGVTNLSDFVRSKLGLTRQ